MAEHSTGSDCVIGITRNDERAYIYNGFLAKSHLSVVQSSIYGSMLKLSYNGKQSLISARNDLSLFSIFAQPVIKETPWKGG